MIEIGRHNVLKILRETSVGLFLGDESGEDVLLPNKYCPADFEIGEELNVFVYLDHEERKVATNLEPKILLHEFALLKVADVSSVGAFLDWGMEKELLVPFKEQRQKMQVGRWYVVYMDLDEETERLFGSNKIERRLQNEELTVEVGEEVKVLVYKETDMGYSVIINNQHKGLVFHNEIFKELYIGDVMKGYIKEIREDNKIDVSLQPIGYQNFNSKNTERIHRLLVRNNGFMPFNDKSSPEEIYDQFGISKKAFKKAIGDLYKQRSINIDAKGIKLR